MLGFTMLRKRQGLKVHVDVALVLVSVEVSSKITREGDREIVIGVSTSRGGVSVYGLVAGCVERYEVRVILLFGRAFVIIRSLIVYTVAV